MLRLSLVLALLAAIGALLVAQLKTKPDLEGVRTELASAKTSLDEAQKGKMASDKAAKEAKAAAEVAVRLSNDFKEKFEVAASDATTQKQRADKLASELETTMKSKNETQAELGRWVALGIKPDEIVS